MNLRFPLSDVKVEFGTEPKVVENPLYEDGFYRLNQDEFSMQVAEVGSFYASGGNYVQVVPQPGVDEASLELYLNGSTYGAILHQRGILPLHGSCFFYRGQGIMICGESGAGKSSLTASFALNGAEFLTDDVTPILFQDNKPFIWAMSDRIKLWKHALDQLKLSSNGLAPIDHETEKYYFPVDHRKGELIPLTKIVFLEKGRCLEPEISTVESIEKFTELRGHVYREEYLQAMPETEAKYLKQLLAVTQHTEAISVKRPENIKIEELRLTLAALL